MGLAQVARRKGRLRYMRTASAENENGTVYMGDTFGQSDACKHIILTGQDTIFAAPGATPSELRGWSPNPGWPKVLLYFNGTHHPTGTPASPPAGLEEAAYIRSSNATTKYLRTGEGSGNWLMDPTNEKWILSRIEAAQSYVAAGYDGIFVDVMGWAPVTQGRYEANADGTDVAGSGQYAPYNARTGTAWTKKQWLDAVVHLGHRVAGGIYAAAGNPVILLNGLGNGLRYYDAAAPTSQRLDLGNGMAEIWRRDADDTPSTFPSESLWGQHLDMLLDATTKGRFIFCLTKLWRTDATQADLDLWFRFGTASFLLGADGRHVWEWFGDTTTGGANMQRSAQNHDNGISYDADWDLALGRRVSAYSVIASAKVGGTNIYRANYERGVSLVNPTAAATNGYALGGSYQRASARLVPTGTPSGTITTIDMPAHEAAVLLKT